MPYGLPGVNANFRADRKQIIKRQAVSNLHNSRLTPFTFLFINIMERIVQLICFHQHHGEAKNGHLFYMCFQ
jgi:hypothetical protein